MKMRQKMPVLRHGPYPPRMARNKSAGQLCATEYQGESERPAPRKRMPRTPSAPGRLEALTGAQPDLNRMSSTAQTDLADAAYFSPSPPPPSPQGAMLHPVALGPNALSLHAPALPGLPLTAADVDRGQVSVSEQQTTPFGRLTLNEARNVGGSALGGSLETMAGAWPCPTKLGASAVVNGQTVGLAPSAALCDGRHNEVGLGISMFGAMHDEVRVLPEARHGEDIAIEARAASTRGFAADPRLFCGPFAIGGFAKVLHSETDEKLYRRSINGRRAAALLTPAEDDGLCAGLKHRVRQWSQAVGKKPLVRQPDILDPFGQNGGRALQPGQELVRCCSRTRMLGGGAGLLGVRGGRHNMTVEDFQITVRALGGRCLHVAVNPRDVTSSSDSVDTLLGPGWQRVSSIAQALSWEQTFDYGDPQQQEAYRRLMALVTSSQWQQVSEPKDATVERSRLQARDDITGWVRLPVKTSWGGLGTHVSRRELQTERDAQGLRSKTRNVMTQTTRHALSQGKHTDIIHTSAHASLLFDAQPFSPMAFRGLTVQAERSASRPDLAHRNAMVDEQKRLWRQDLPPVTRAPRTDYAASAATVFSGRQLRQLQSEIPQRASIIAKRVGATPEGVPGLIEDLRQVGRSDDHPADLAWKRSELVIAFLQREGESGLACLHALLGGGLMVQTRSSSYEEPLHELVTLQKTRRITPKRAHRLKASIETALQALEADVILFATRRQHHRALRARLEAGLRALQA